MQAETIRAASNAEARILIIDDEEPNVLLLERLLSRAGYTDLRSTTHFDPRVVAAFASILDGDPLRGQE